MFAAARAPCGIFVDLWTGCFSSYDVSPIFAYIYNSGCVWDEIEELGSFTIVETTNLQALHERQTAGILV